MSHATTRTHLIAPKELIEKVDRLVGPRRRSEFIASAVDEKLRREQLLQAVQEAAKLPADRDIPGWKLRKLSHSGCVTSVRSQTRKTSRKTYEISARH